MPQSDQLILLGIGGLFLLLGLIAIIWDRVEKKKYFDSIVGRPDVREFLDGWPQRPQFGGLKTGGLIAVTIGLLMIIAGGSLWLWG